MSDKTEFVVVNTTVDEEDLAAGLASKIVGEKLAACVQIVPVRSTYRWKGAIETADEHLLMAKTRSALAKELVAFIKNAHPYEVPEIIITPILDGHDDYLKWIDDACR